MNSQNEGDEEAPLDFGDEGKKETFVPFTSILTLCHLGDLLPAPQPAKPVDADGPNEGEADVAVIAEPVLPVYVCHSCGSVWDNPRKRNGHMSSCGRRKKSSNTSKNVSKSQSPRTTQDLHHSQPVPASGFDCDICGKTFPTSKGRSSHKGRVHKKSSLSLPL